MAGWPGRGRKWSRVGPNKGPAWAAAPFRLTRSLTAAPASRMARCLNGPEANQDPSGKGAFLAQSSRTAAHVFPSQTSLRRCTHQPLRMLLHSGVGPKWTSKCSQTGQRTRPLPRSALSLQHWRCMKQDQLWSWASRDGKKVLES